MVPSECWKVGITWEGVEEISEVIEIFRILTSGLHGCMLFSKLIKQTYKI